MNESAASNAKVDESAASNAKVEECPVANEVIVVCPDGPLLVRGDIDIVSTTGEKIARRRKTVALCRCGASAIKPYCDGSHKRIGFSTEAEPPI